MEPLTISTECGDSLDKFIDAIVKEKWIEKGKLATAEDFYVEIKDKQISTYPEVHEVDFLVLKDECKGYKNYIRHKQTFNIEEDKQDFKSILFDYKFNLSNRLNTKGVIAEIEDDRIKVYSLTKALRDQKEGRTPIYDFRKLAKIKLIIKK